MRLSAAACLSRLLGSKCVFLNADHHESTSVLLPFIASMFSATEATFRMRLYASAGVIWPDSAVEGKLLIKVLIEACSASVLPIMP